MISTVSVVYNCWVFCDLRLVSIHLVDAGLNQQRYPATSVRCM